MNKAQKVALISMMIVLKALHVLFVHESTHPGGHDVPDDKGSEGGHGTKYAYNTVIAVILAEAMKLAVSAILFWRAYAKERQVTATGSVELTPLEPGGGGTPTVSGSAMRDWEALTPHRSLAYALPALIYMIEDNLRFVVLQQLHTPVTWMIFGHLEIPFVAVMSTVLLGRVFTQVQWVSVAVLLCGVMSSQLAVCESRLKRPCTSMSNYPLKGIALVTMCAFFAASAGIASEFIYKRDKSVSIWLQNCLLYSYAIGINVLLLAGSLAKGSKRTEPEMSLLEGFDAAMPWMVVITMGGMGLCVSAVIKHMSNLAKVYTSALCIFVTALLSAALEGFELSLPFVLSACIVFCALYLYVIEQDRQTKPDNAACSPKDRAPVAGAHQQQAKGLLWEAAAATEVEAHEKA